MTLPGWRAGPVQGRGDPGSLRERFIDEQGHHAVLDYVRALRRDRHAHEHEEVGGRHAQRDADLNAAWSRLQPLCHDGRQDQEAAEEE